MKRIVPFFVAIAVVACDGSAAPSPGPASAPAASPRSAPRAVSAADGVADPVAKIAGEPVTLADLDKAAAAGLVKARQQMYDVRNQALEQLVQDRLLETEAKSRGVSKDDLVAQEIDAKFEAVADGDVETFFNQNQARMRGSLDQMRDQIRGYLEQQRKGARMQEFVTSLKEKNSVEIFLEPPRIMVDPGDSPRYGSADAPVEIIEFSDFQCPYCSRAATTVDEIKQKYGDKVTIVFRHFPLSFHNRAHRTAEASQCAHDQGKFWEFHDQVFANQRALEDADLTKYAASAGVDGSKFTECLNSGRNSAIVEEDMKDGSEAGMTGTPGFYINGRFIGGAQPLEVFTEIIDAELAKKG